ncbi:MAG TPA: acyltransferase family protein [Polyangiaceae bacterium]|nr:acyltransferase family protein [Polyangiaceae bacterium]
MSSPSLHSHRIPHVAALDGLRGLGVTGVLLFHANGLLPGGYLGVDLFFVLSGYLITCLLLAEHETTGRIDLSSFWVRRARRLFPALLSLMPAVALYGRYVARADELEALRLQALASLGYLANWHAIFGHRSYWQLFAAPSPLEHTWSLSIEEQFYVLWPLVVTLVLRRHGKRTILALSLALCVLSMGAMMLLFQPGDTSRAYLGTDTRMAGILSGAALATLLPPGRTLPAALVRGLDWLGVGAALGLGVAWCTLSGTRPFLYHGGFWLTELAVLVLIVCAVMGEKSFVARALSVRPLASLGIISYGVYLWHWPVNVFLTEDRTHLHGVPFQAMRFALTFTIAAASYRFLERPIRRHGVPFGRPQYIVPAAVTLSVFLIVHATYARNGRTSPPFASEHLGASGSPPEFVRYRVLVFGDSTANSLGWGLRSLHEKGVAVELLGKDGCTMLDDRCDGEHWVEHVRELHPDATLVYLAGAFLHGFGVQGSWHTACHADWDARFEKALTRRLRELASTGARIFAIVAPYPVGRWDTVEYRAQMDCINASLRKAAAAAPAVHVLDAGEKLCPRGVCEQEIPGKVKIRPDGVHFSLAGAQGVSRWVFEQIRR